MPPKKPSKKKTTSKPSNGDLAVLIEALRDDVRQVAEGQNGLVRKIEDVRLELKAEIQEKYVLLSGAMAQTQEDISVLKEDVKVLKEDVKVLKEDVKVLKEDIRVLKEDVVQIKGELSQTREELRGEIQSLREEFHTHTHTS